VPSLLYWLIGLAILLPQVLPVVWQRLIWLIHAVGTAAATGQPAEATLGIVNIILLLLPWIGSLMLLGMMLHGPARWVLARCAPTRLQMGWLR